MVYAALDHNEVVVVLEDIDTAVDDDALEYIVAFDDVNLHDVQTVDATDYK